MTTDTDTSLGPDTPMRSRRSHTPHTGTCLLSDKLLLSRRMLLITRRVLENRTREKRKDWRIVIPTPKQDPGELHEEERGKMRTRTCISLEKKLQPKTLTASVKPRISPGPTHLSPVPVISFTSVIQAGARLRSRHHSKPCSMRQSLTLDFVPTSTSHLTTDDSAFKPLCRPATAKTCSQSFTFNENCRVSVALPLPTRTLSLVEKR